MQCYARRLFTKFRPVPLSNQPAPGMWGFLCSSSFEISLLAYWSTSQNFIKICMILNFWASFMCCVLLLPQPLLAAFANNSLGGDFQWQRAPCIESCCLSFWGTAAWKERNTRDVGWETVNQQNACEQSKPKARHLVGLSHHCLWSCRLLRFTWAVIFPSRKLTLPPFSQRHSQGHCLVSLPYQLSTFQIQRLSCHSYWI